MKFNLASATERIASLLPYLSEEQNPDLADSKAKAEKVVLTLRKLVEDLGVSLALKDYGISKEQARDVAKFIANEQQKNYALPDLNPRPINEADMISMFEEMWHGNL